MNPEVNTFHCNRCYKYWQRHGELPAAAVVSNLDHISRGLRLWVPLEAPKDGCPRCGTHNSSCFQRVRGLDDGLRYCQQCWRVLAAEQRKNKSKDGAVAKPKPKPARPKKTYGKKPSPSTLPCALCQVPESSYWRRIQTIGDGRDYCNTCSSYYYVHKALPMKRRNRFAADTR